jgi:hypothetical protein
MASLYGSSWKDATLPARAVALVALVALLPLSACFSASPTSLRSAGRVGPAPPLPGAWPRAALRAGQRAGCRARLSGVWSGIHRSGRLGAGAARMVESPIAGATVSDDGFVVFLSYMASGRYFEEEMYIPVVVNCEDTDVVQSPEALTLLQLLQGIDMATPLLPPDALPKAYEELYGDVGSVALTEVHIYPPTEPLIGRPRAAGAGGPGGAESDSSTDKALSLSAEQRALREAKILQRAPDLVKALKHLNVRVDEDRAIGLLRTYASAEGDLDRGAFSEALAAARVPVNLKPPGSLATFTLVAVTDDSVGKELNVSAFVALSLHLRHKAPVVIKGGRRAPGVGEVMPLHPHLVHTRLLATPTRSFPDGLEFLQDVYSQSACRREGIVALW